MDVPFRVFRVPRPLPRKTIFPHFTDTTENLVKFMAAAGDDLFSKEVLLKLERVK